MRTRTFMTGMLALPVNAVLFGSFATLVLSIPALRAAWRADGILATAAADPAAIREGRLEGSEFARRASLGWKGLTGRW